MDEDLDPPQPISLPERRLGVSGSIELGAALQFLTGSAIDAATFPWEHLRAADLRVLRAWAAAAFPPAGASRVLASVRAAIRASRAYLDESATSPDICRSRSKATPGRRLTPRESRALLDACADDASASGRRDAAIIALLLLGGLRPADIASLALGDYEDDAIILRLRCRNRRDILRALSLDIEAQASLDDWLAARGHASGPLFLAVDYRGCAREGAGVGPSAIAALVARRARAAGLARLTPSDLRADYLAGLRRQSRPGSFTVPAHFTYTAEDEPCLVFTTLPAPARPQSQERPRRAS